MQGLACILLQLKREPTPAALNSFKEGRMGGLAVRVACRRVVGHPQLSCSPLSLIGLAAGVAQPQGNRLKHAQIADHRAVLAAGQHAVVGGGSWRQLRDVADRQCGKDAARTTNLIRRSNA